MWTARTQTLHEGRTLRCRFLRDAAELTTADALEGWRRDAGFRDAFREWLANLPFAACFWEMPPIRAGALDRPFECIVTDSPQLAGATADIAPFADPLSRSEARAPVATFANLGGDAVLVVPRADSPQHSYPHLTSFARTAPRDTQHAFWQAVGDAAAQRLGPQPLWISTSGLGVYWLHVRLDDRPKYYTFTPYRAVPDD